MKAVEFLKEGPFDFFTKSKQEKADEKRQKTITSLAGKSLNLWKKYQDQIESYYKSRGQSTVPENVLADQFRKFVTKNILQIDKVSGTMATEVNKLIGSIQKNFSNDQAMKKGFEQLVALKGSGMLRYNKPDVLPVQPDTSTPKPTPDPKPTPSSQTKMPPIGAVIPKSKNLPAIKWNGDAWTSMDGVVKYATTPDTIARLNQAYFNAKKAGII